MQYEWNIIRAMIHCNYKAWCLTKDQVDPHHIKENDSPLKFEQVSPDSCRLFVPVETISSDDKLASIAWHLQQDITSEPIKKIHIQYDRGSVSVNVSRYESKVQKFLIDFRNIVRSVEPPSFYRNAHCPDCQFKEACMKKLKDRDCLSLLGGMSPKILAKYHKKGIFSIMQLSHIFRPRRRRGRPSATGTYLWELKALAIREQKTFIMQSPSLPESDEAIYIDFEGLPDEGWIYLIGGIIKRKDRPDETFSFWADRRELEKQIFDRLFDIFREYPEAPVYHYGSYESHALKLTTKKWPKVFKHDFTALEKRMVNILGFLRTHIYPPTYTNGLKEVAGFLNFKWRIPEGDGRQSIVWRKIWEGISDDDSKEKLLLYNEDDCKALARVHTWIQQIATDAPGDKVQQVSQMKRQSPYRFQSNPQFSEDFQYINRAAYFDYQHTKIYWRNKRNSKPQKHTLPSRSTGLQPRPGRGHVAWNPKTVNETIIAPLLKRCPKCNGTKLYHSKKRTSFRQTDLRFTPSGIKKWVTEYQSASAKCPVCNSKPSNRALRMLHYGDNLFAWAINLYVRYHISNEMIARLLMEQFGIWLNPLYMMQRKYKWLRQWKPTVDYIWEIIKNSPVIHIDETTIRLSKDRGYVWTFATPHSVFYHFTPTRESDFLHEWLQGYKGVIVTDSFPGYETLRLKQQKCLIHLIRDLNDDLFKNPFDEEYKTLVTAFGKLLRPIITTIDRFGLQKKHLEKHKKETAYFFDKLLLDTYKSELAVKCVKRLRKHWDELWTFLSYDNVTWNNNNAEAAIKAFVQFRRGVNGQISERGLKEYLEMLSIAQTCRYRNISFLDFLRRKKGIWDKIDPDALPGFLPFDQARLFIRQLGFERKHEWNAWKREGKRPAFIPSSPNTTYGKTGWISWHDWLGFSFMPFEQARTYMRKLKLKNREEYWAWLKSGKRPRSIPACPEDIYKHIGWKDLGDWLGTGNTGQQKKQWLPYEQAKAYIQALGIKTQHDYFRWRQSGQRPETIPTTPNIVYPEFKSWGEFLGTNRIANQLKEYWEWEQAKEFLAQLNIKSIKHFKQLIAMEVIPSAIPKNPRAFYLKEGKWTGYVDFLSINKSRP